jgi:RNA polymerase sigma factor (sigma-70 family)
MDEVIKLVKTYRLTSALDQRLRLAEEIFRQVEPQLRFFVFHTLTHPAGEDVLQETLKAATVGLTKFKGDLDKEFWGWCYGIARNKVKDHLRKTAADRLQPMEPEELWQLVETSAQNSPLSPEDRMDLQHALKILAEAKPECSEFLWRHFVLGLDYSELAEERQMSYDNVRMKIGRCLDEAQALMA